MIGVWYKPRQCCCHLVEPRKEPNFSYRLLRAIYPAFRLLFPNQVIRADDLAQAMVNIAVQEIVPKKSAPISFLGRKFRGPKWLLPGIWLPVNSLRMT